MPSNTRSITDDPSVLEATRAAQAARQSVAGAVVSATGFVFLVALAGQARVPIPGTEVPMTLQLIAVLLVGLSLSPKVAATALSAYLVLGTLGLPVFSPGSSGLWGPTGGYLVGFIPAACLIGVLRGRGEVGILRLFLAGAVGVTVVFVCGIGWRMVWLAGDWRLALQTGLLPFALKAIVELCLAVALVLSIRRWQGRCGGLSLSECVR